MSLNWTVDQIPNYKTLCWDEGGDMNPVTNALIWMTMSVGIGNTKQDPDEFVWRVLFFEKLFGANLWNEGGPRFLTVEEVRAHIGLHTNAGEETHASFVKQVALRHRYHIIGKERP